MTTLISSAPASFSAPTIARTSSPWDRGLWKRFGSGAMLLAASCMFSSLAYAQNATVRATGADYPESFAFSARAYRRTALNEARQLRRASLGYPESFAFSARAYRRTALQETRELTPSHEYPESFAFSARAYRRTALKEARHLPVLQDSHEGTPALLALGY